MGYPEIRCEFCGTRSEVCDHVAAVVESQSERLRVERERNAALTAVLREVYDDEFAPVGGGFDAWLAERAGMAAWRKAQRPRA